MGNVSGAQKETGKRFGAARFTWKTGTETRETRIERLPEVLILSVTPASVLHRRGAQFRQGRYRKALE